VDKTPPDAPTVTSGPPAITGPSSPFIFAWTLQPTATSSRWQLLDGLNVIAEGATTAPDAQVAVAPVLAPGDRVLSFRVSLLDSVLNPSLVGRWPAFVVDQTPPGLPTGLSGPTGTSRNLTPSFSWQGTEVGGTFEWNVVDAAGAGILGPGADRTTASTTLTAPPLPLAPNLVHHLTFLVRQIDPYGNRGEQSAFLFTVTTVPVASPAPRTRLAGLMSPVAGHTLATLRPLLRWRRTAAGTTLYNVQIYAGKRKVFSVFPLGRSLRVPKGRLKPGTRYIWYVWAYIGKQKRYIALPMTSWFQTKP
jgi:hypothetical protein